MLYKCRAVWLTRHPSLNWTGSVKLLSYRFLVHFLPLLGGPNVRWGTCDPIKSWPKLDFQETGPRGGLLTLVNLASSCCSAVCCEPCCVWTS